MSLSISGEITKIYKAEKGTSKAGKEWIKQSFKIDTKAKFGNEIVFSCFNDNVDLLQGFKAGQSVHVSFNLSSREFNGKFYHNLDAWKIALEAGDVASAPKKAVQVIAEPEDDDDDLPF